MPSKSRKKIKGQERKAKAKAAAANNTASNLTNRIGSGGGDTSWQSLPNDTPRCKHGLKEPNTTIVDHFISIFFQNILNSIWSLNNNPGLSAKSTSDALSDAYSKFPEAVNDESNRDTIKNNFISTGVSSLLGKSGTNNMNGPDNSAIMARICAAAV